MKFTSFPILAASSLLLAAQAMAAPAPQAVTGQSTRADHQRIVEHWSAARRAAAQPRDLFIDAQGQGYLRSANGQLIPYGLTPAAQQLRAEPLPQAKPASPGGGGGSSDTTGPSISALSPADGTVIGSSQTFSAVITDDASGVKSVSFVITYPDGSTTQSFSPGFAGNDTWSITLNGFSDGQWSWHVEATDGAKRGGNKTISASAGFVVDTGSSGGGGSGGDHVVSNAGWSAGGVVQEAAGRIYFEMPDNNRRRRWSGYVCSGTVAADGATGRSVIITAAHCVYDDANKAFARNVLFIPNQDATTGSGTDSNCGNDPLGCWTPRFAVVDVNWTNRTFPDNVAWDYAYYVVSDSGAHSGTAAGSEALDVAVTPMGVSFATPIIDDGDPSATSPDFTHALGYSYSDDPNFMYCAEDMTADSSVNWWLGSCGLSGGSSGGPWVQPMNAANGDGPIISVNSWGLTQGTGMAGPRLDASSAGCLFGEASGVAFASIPSTDGDAGLVVDYCP